MTDSTRELGELSTAFDRANTSITRTGQAFGELAKSSQEWNIISRILSGTGMWRLQNQIRAVGNIINVYHNRQEQARKSTLAAVDANEKLAESMKDIDRALMKTDAQIRKTPLFAMFDKAGRDGIKEYKNMWKSARDEINKADRSVTKALRPSRASKYIEGKMGTGQFLSETFGVSQTLSAGKRAFMAGKRALLPGISSDKGLNQLFEGVEGTRRFGNYGGLSTITAIGSSLKDKGKFGLEMLNNRQYQTPRAQEAWAKIGTKLSPIATKVKSFFVIGLAVLGKAMLFFVALVTGFALLIFIIKKLEIKKRLENFEKKFGYFGELFGEIKTLLGAVFSMFRAAFEGDGAGLWKGFKLLITTLVAILETIVKIVLRGIFEIVKALPSLILRALKGIGGGIKNIIFGRANGGVVGSGELTLVGERGPELVRLPSGARVHSNAESRRMSGSNIHVHVNGRVGASDAEIRDIANKVAREINLKMNRTAHTTGRL
jgi:hypothetical protein